MIRGMARMQEDEVRAIASGASGLGARELEMMRRRFGPACGQPEEMLAFQAEWLGLPGEAFAASAVALAVEMHAATE